MSTVVTRVLALAVAFIIGLLPAGCAEIAGFGDEPPTPCSDGARDCDSVRPRRCEAGTWIEEASCGDPTPACVAGQCVASASCQADLRCGPLGQAQCCESLRVEGGGVRRSGGAPTCEDRDFDATVSSFALDRFEITVGRFRAFIDAGLGTMSGAPVPGAGTHPSIPGSGWNSEWNASLTDDDQALRASLAACQGSRWTDEPGADETAPMGCITWFEAFAFCAWDGGRLPTELEWSYAAQGGCEQRAYPWSEPAAEPTIDESRAVYQGTSGGAPLPVGSRPSGAGRWGQEDLAGNVREWTLDWFDEYPASCTDCARVSTSPASTRVDRGGGVLDTAVLLGAARRSATDPAHRQFDMGARCAR